MPSGRERLDQPNLPRRGPRVSYDPEAFGRLTERVARFLGTGRYLLLQSFFIIVWILLNTLPLSHHWDPYAFLFLTLILSLQAAYSAPLILLAQNRQDDRDRVNLEEDRGQARRSAADMEYLAREIAAIRIALGDVVTRDYLRSEISRYDRFDESERDKERRHERDRDKERRKDKSKNALKDSAKSAQKQLEAPTGVNEPSGVNDPTPAGGPSEAPLGEPLDPS
ncbi:MAG: hypothetical protein JWO63_965 [Frankiales bacterium]|nr:hypothetical protein [Frankiales bacterium]